MPAAKVVSVFHCVCVCVSFYIAYGIYIISEYVYMKYRIYERLTVLYDEWKNIYIYIAGTSDISDMSLSFVTFSMYLMWRGNKQQLQPCHTTLITFVIETLILRRVRYTRPFTVVAMGPRFEWHICDIYHSSAIYVSLANDICDMVYTWFEHIIFSGIFFTKYPCTIFFPET